MTLQRTWTELVSRNPMLIEIARFRRKFLSISGSNAVGGVILGLIAICYVGIVTLVVTFRTDIPPLALVAVQTIIFVLLAPTLLHSAIAGEREKRSWDLLLAAPITKAQIVVGKFIGALSAVGIGTAAFVFPIGITAFSYKDTNFWDLGLAEVICLSFTVLVCSITIFFSARVKRSFMALGATLGVLAVSLLVVPAMLGVLVTGGGGITSSWPPSSVAAEVAPLLAAGVRPLFPSLAGRTPSPAPQAQLELSASHTQLRALLAELGAARGALTALASALPPPSLT